MTSAPETEASLSAAASNVGGVSVVFGAVVAGGIGFGLVSPEKSKGNFHFAAKKKKKIVEKLQKKKK